MRGTDSYGVIVAIKSPKTGALGTARRAGVTEVRVSFDEANKTDEWHEVTPAFRGFLVSFFFFRSPEHLLLPLHFRRCHALYFLESDNLLQMNLLR